MASALLLVFISLRVRTLDHALSLPFQISAHMYPATVFWEAILLLHSLSHLVRYLDRYASANSIMTWTSRKEPRTRA
ncbi:hypothetical protein EDB86DRAFT_1842972 [Lactarius hatsudake]|nr:hypothetical protein EDB86DRAFT_1842972 [Lactarius hatsudake]